MESAFIPALVQEFNIKPNQVEAVLHLLGEGASVPFIARYRKEATGGLDEVMITSIRDRFEQLVELFKRKETVISSITDQGKLTDELKEKILATETMSVLEDLYLPFRPKRRTRATAAKEKGLEPLAKKVFSQEDFSVEDEAKKFVNAKMEVNSIEEALSGARDIIAEWINEDSNVRAQIRGLFFEQGHFQAKVNRNKEIEGAKYRDYFDWNESVKTVPSHRILAVRRGEKEGILMMRVAVTEEEAFQILEDLFVTAANEAAEQVKTALRDSFKRLLSLSIETEVRIASKELADEEAVKVFAKNLRELLMAPALGERMVLAIDPGFRTGCKVVVLGGDGQLLHYETVFPTGSEYQRQDSAASIQKLCQKFSVEFIAIGSGTAGRETESFIRSIGLPKEIQIVVVNESGASIYSASEVAREEFPDHDVTVRGAVSIGRRLMDPLAELVKIDPKSIGVGQYQHDVDQKMLKDGLDDIVISCVNAVGVELNTASKQLLMYVSGLGPTRAQALIDYRNKNGKFFSRAQLKEVSGLGAKAFEQAAAFLRIRQPINPLDASAVHPESYFIVEQMAKDLNCRILDLMQKKQLRDQINLDDYVTEQIGPPTLKDILSELAKPGRDPREKFEIFQFKEGVQRPEDLRPGMKLPGIVTNVTKFGCFVDVGVHLDGLVHISQLSDRYVKDPSEVVKVQQKVHVTVLEVDLERQRIGLSMKKKQD